MKKIALYLLILSFLFNFKVYSQTRDTGREIRKGVVNFTDLANYQLTHPVPFTIHTHENVMANTGTLPALTSDSTMIHRRTSVPAFYSSSLPSFSMPISFAPADTFESTPFTSWYPPDTHGAVDSNYCVTTVNGALHIQTRTGVEVGSLTLNSFWSAVYSGTTATEPRIYYDLYAHRWIMITAADATLTTSCILVAISVTGDPTGSWYEYQISADATGVNWMDFPNLGVNNKWICISGNMFSISSGSFVNSKIFCIDKATCLTGSTSSYTTLTDANFGLCPVFTYSASESNLFVVSSWNGTAGVTRLMKISGAVGSESISTIGYPGTSMYWQYCSNAVSGTAGADFAPQLGSSNLIQANDDRITQGIFVNGKIWYAHTVFLPYSTISNPTRSSIQWWQTDSLASPLQVGRVDDATGTNFYAFPSISVNTSNDALIGFSVLAANIHPSCGYALRLHTDASDSMRPLQIYRHGLNAYYLPSSGRNRWGDYSGTALDPINMTDFWTIQETTNAGVNSWDTWWAHIRPCYVPGPITGSSSICPGATVSLADTTSGGTWSSSNTAIATINSSGVVTGVSAGTVTISYSKTYACGTTNAYSLVTVNAAPTIPIITPAHDTICTGSSVVLSGLLTTLPGTIVSQNFNIGLTGSVGGTWTVVNTGATSAYSWALVAPTALYFDTTIIGDGTQYVEADANLAGAGVNIVSSLISPSFSTVGYSSVTLKYNFYVNATWSGDNNSAVQYSIDGGTTWTTLVDYVGTCNGSPTFSAAVPNATLSLPPAAIGAPNVKIRFYYNSIEGYYWVVDNVVIIGTPMTITGPKWSPVTYLFTNSGFTTPYTLGTSHDTLYLHPTSVTVPTVITYYDTVSNGTCKSYDSTIITINPLPSVGTISGTNNVCVGAVVTLTDATGGGAWTASNGHATVSGGVVTGVTAGADTISYSVTNSCGTVSTTFAITINPLPSAGTITGLSTVCVGSAITLTDGTSGGTWSASNTNASVLGGVVTGVTAGTDIISYSVTNSCGTVSTTKSITVNSLPSAGTISGSSSVCVGATVTLADATGGGTWTASNGTATVTSGNVTGVSAGTDTISYTVTSCGSASATFVITINPLPNAGTISGLSSVCVGAVITLTDGVSGGTWSVSNSNATVSSGNVSGVTPGTDTISYTVSNSCGTATATKTITVNALPSAGTITGTTNVCVGAITTLADAISGGIWSSSNGNATVSSGTVTGVTSGTDTISYTVTTCGSASAIFAITINPLPIAGTISGLSTVCVGSIITLTDGASGGSWSASNGNATISGGNVTGISAGTDIISYTVTNSCGSASATMNITINPLPVAGAITGSSIVCVGSIATLTDGISGGTWSASNGNATVTGGNVTGVIAGADTIIYTVTNSCGTASTTFSISVNPLPIAGTISGLSTVCVGSNITLTDGISGGTWSASNSNATVLLGNVTGVTAGTDVISYTVTNSCGAASATELITVNALPSSGTISGTTNVCVGATITLTEATGGGVWSASNGNATVSGGNVTGITAGADTISYTVSNSCGTSSTTFTITINPLPNPGTISGLSTVCVGSIITLADGSSGGSWSASNSNATVLSGNVTGVTAGTDAISYTVTNSCGSASATTNITINPLPVGGTISGSSTVCVGSVITLTDGSSGGSWSASNANATVSGGNVTGATAGVDSITYSVTNGCGTATATYLITVNPLPNAGSITGLSLVCIGSTITLTDGISGGIWNAGNTNASVSGGIVTGVTAGIDSISYTVTNSCGSAIATMSITINPMPVSGFISGVPVFCYTALDTLSDTTSGGVWSSSATAIATVSPSGIVAGIASGSVVISYSVTNYCGTSVSSKSLTLEAVPSAGSITGSTGFCVFTSSTLSDAVAGGVWSSSVPGIALPDSIGIVAGLEPGTANITYSVSNTCGTATSVVNITVNPLPATGAVLVSSTSVCVGSAIAAVDTIVGGTWSLSDTTIATIDTGGIITGVSIGVVNISYSLTNGCGTVSSTQPVTVIAIPTPGPIGGPTNICVAGTGTLSNSVTGGTWVSGNTALATIDSTTGVVSGVSSGIDTIYYTASNACGSTTVSAIITINFIPVAGTIYGDSVLCESSVVVLSDLVGGGTWSSSASGVAVVGMAGIVTGIAGGTATISYSITNTCGTALATKNITINPLPHSGTIAGSSLVCLSSVSPFTDSVVGGVWTSSDTSIIQINSAGISAGISLGNAVISYSYTNACGTSVATFAVAVGSLPTVTAISGPTNVCQSSTITLVDGTTGGSWGSSNPSLATVNSSGVVSGIFPGIVIISYTKTNSCGTVSTTQTVTVNASPNAGVISGTTNVCISAMVTLVDSIGGGVWSSSNAAVASVNSLSGIVTGNTTGSATITYSVTNGCGSAFAVFSEIVSLSPVVGSVLGASQVCVGATSALGDSISGGSWSSSNTAIATVGSSTGFVYGVNSGSLIITYTVSNSCGSVFSTKAMTVNPDPPMISGPSFVCIGTSTSLADSLSGGIWTSSNISNATVDSFTGIVHGVSPGSAIITYRLATGCFASISIAIDPLPYAGTIAGSGSLCVGSSSLLIDMVSGGVWSAANGNATVSGGTLVGITAGIDTIHYAVTNTCGTGTASKTVTINAAPVSGSITGLSNVCSGSTITMSETVPGGSWNVTNTHAAISPVGLLTGLSAGVDTILYSISNLCGITTALKVVTVSPIPAPISGTTFICQGNIYTLTDAVGGGTWTSSSPATASIDSSTGALLGINYGNVTITYSESLACFATATVTINPLPPAISGPNQVCVGAYISMIDSATGSWTATNASGLIDPMSGSLIGNYAGIDTIMFSLTTGCSTKMVVTVNAVPSPITGSGTVCINSQITLSDASATGGWSSLGAVASVDVFTGVVTGIMTGTDTIMYTLPDGCSVNWVVTINALPSLITGISTVCQSANITLADSTTGGTWSVSNSNATVDAAAGIVTGNSVGSDTVFYTLPTGCAKTSIITVNPLPFAGGIVGPDTLCMGNHITYTDTVLSGIWSLSNGAATIIGGSVTTNYAGWDTISYAVTNSCGTLAATKPIYIMTLPNVGSITGSGNLCLGTSPNTLSDAVLGGTWVSQNPLVASVTSTGILSGISLGVDTVFYSLGNMCGNSTASILVTVDTFPVTSILGRTYVCEEKYDTLIGNPLGGSWSSTDTNIVVAGNVILGHSVGFDTIVYSVINFCGSSTSKFALKVPSKHECDSIDYVANVGFDEEQIRIYPNPNTGIFTIEIPDNQNDLEVIIYDMYGMLMDRVKTGNKRKLDYHLDQVARGTYVVDIINNGKTYVQKLVVW